MEQKLRTPLGWIDTLRVLACFLVVISHCCDPFVGQFDKDRSAFLTGVFTGSLVRPCVPLFVMMTGVLLFPVRVSMGEFYRRRIGRIVVPLAFWSVVLPILFFIYLNYINPGTTNPSIVMADHTLAATLTKFYTFVFNFNFDTVPLWYLYMLIGLYLIMPVLSVWIQQASRQDLLLFLRIWGISLVLPYLKMVAPVLGYTGNWGNRGILGVCDWNDYGTFYYVSGFIGYLVLAHYLVKFPPTWSWQRLLSITVPMFGVGYIITAYGFVLTQRYFPGNYANLEIIWYFAGINVFMMTVPVFVVVQKLNVAASPALSKLASLTFGIYLCHFVFVQIAYDVLAIPALPNLVRLLGMAVLTFGVSYGIVRVLDQFRATRRFVA